MAEIDNWIEAQEFQITLDAQGKIIDFIDNNLHRSNTPEERIRQKWRTLSTMNWDILKSNWIRAPDKYWARNKTGGYCSLCVSNSMRR